jgi:DNA/RNA endonuclease G (NUC1)
MKKLSIVILAALFVGLACFYGFRTDARQLDGRGAEVSPHLMISQFQTGGGTANDEFIEIHNSGPDPIDLSGYSLVYRSASGTNDVLFMNWASGTIVPSGGYYLVASNSYDGATVPNVIYNNTTCQCAMALAGGGLAIRQGAPNTGAVIDSVGWGTATNAFVETTVTSAPAVNNSQSRLDGGCHDTDSNINDFTSTVPSAPRNASTTPNTCGGGGTTLFAAFNANPSTISPGAKTLLTVTVIPATTPPSTGISVSANLLEIGGPFAQDFFDDGTGGDVTAGDHVFSFLVTTSADLTGGTRNLAARVTDAEGRVVNPSLTLTVNAPLPNDDPLILGNPSNATPDTANENNYLMPKPQYTLSYDRSKATPNWVAWHLDSTWIGGAQRQDDYRPDTALPSGWYAVTDQDYSGAGYDRGHMCPSGDRTNSVPNNSATFLMTNFVPQLSANNQGPWEDLESYCRTLAQAGNELYIIDGPVGNIGTIAGGKIVVPQYTWKVVIVLPNGDNDLSRISKSTRAFGIIVPNFPPVDMQAQWRSYRVTVDAVEYLTGYDFFSKVPKITQELIERRRDIQ